MNRGRVARNGAAPENTKGSGAMEGFIEILKVIILILEIWRG